MRVDDIVEIDLRSGARQLNETHRGIHPLPIPRPARHHTHHTNERRQPARHRPSPH
ncbi:MAG: hypothetical protein LC790_03470 [Actinobacteria bacterium]|nr:hypothetical protein [Actinomycetota bacterium]